MDFLLVLQAVLKAVGGRKAAADCPYRSPTIHRLLMIRVDPWLAGKQQLGGTFFFFFEKERDQGYQYNRSY